MAGSVTRRQAEGYWTKYNKDGNDVLTVEEVKQCLGEVYESVDDFDVNEKFVFFGQKEAKSLTKEEFMTGIMRTEACSKLKNAFKEMDTDGNGSLTKDELAAGLKDKCSIEGEQADMILEELEYDNDGKYCINEFLDIVASSEHFVNTYKF